MHCLLLYPLHGGASQGLQDGRSGVVWPVAALKRREPESQQWWGEKLSCLEEDSAATCSS